ncbi:AGAP002654-PB [Anopheles gambiae str. PEST]|uniref:AGAP002654-PB n=2 Tax=gambiae species complex TaxID=44542 RepID=F5HKQ8_ANOGA|nr:AGAP002654-PB [Anopheles gambiae str. PEST]
MTDAEKTAPETTAETKETTKAENDGTEGDVQKDNEHQRTINVGNLPKDITEQQLRDHFAGHEVERVEIYHYLRNTLALLVFKEKAAAQKACEEKDGSMLNDRRLRIHIEYITIRYTKKDVIVAVLDDDMTEEKLYDRVKEHCEVTQVFIFHPLGYVHLGKDVDKAAVLEKLNAGGLKAYDVNGRDQNQHVDLWRAAKLFFRNRNRVQLLNIPQKWVENTEELKKACSEAGTITEAIANNVSQGSSNYYARIFFETEEQAAKAAELLNGKVFEGKRIHALHLSSALLPNYKTSVYVAPLERTVTEEEVYEHFKQFGDIDFVNRRNCGENAIVCYKTSEAAEKALACTTFPAPTEANKEATKTVTVLRYDGPLVLRATSVKRKAASGTAKGAAGEGKTRESRPAGGSDREKSHKDILQKLQAFYPVYVSNIPFSCPAHVIREFFSGAGGEVKFIFSPQHYHPYRLSSPQPVKTAMVYYTRRSDMLNAIKQLDKKMLNNQHLHVLPGRGDCNFSQQKTVKLSKITESLSEDAIFRKMRPLGKVVRLTKKNRSLAFVEFADAADVEKVLKMKPDELTINCVYSKITKDVSRRLYNESDPRILGTIVRLLRRNPKMLNKTTGAGPLMGGNTAVGGGPGGFGGGKRPRMNGPPGGFGNVPPFNPNAGGNNLNNNQAIQDLLRLAFMSGKNVGESLAAGGGNVGGNQGPNRGGGGGGSFNNADPPISNQGGGNNAFGGGDGGFGAGGGGGGGGRNMNNRNQNMNFRGGNRNNQNNNVGGNRGLGNNSNNNAGGNNNFGNQNQSGGGSGGPRGGGGALGGGGGNNNSGGGMMNNRNMNNMNNRNNSNNMNMNNKRTGGNNNLPQQNAALPAGGVAAAVGGGNMNKGGGMRGNNNQGMGGGGSGMGSGGGGNMNMNRSNNSMGGGSGMGGGNNRNNRNNFNDTSSFGGVGGGNSNSFGGGNNNFSNDNFGGGRNNDNSYSNDNFGGGRNDSYSSDSNFGGNSGGGGGGRNNFGGNRNNDSYGSNRNDNFGGSGGGSSNFGGGNAFGNNSRFSNDNDGPFSGNSGGNAGGGNNSFGANNRGNNSSNSRFSDDNIGGGGYGGGGNTSNRGGNFNDSGNNFGGNNRGSGGNQKPQGLFNLGGGGGSGGGNLGGSGNMSYNNNFGGGNSNNSGGNNFRNNDNNKGGWNSNNSGLGGGRSNNNQDNIGRLAGSLFSRRF